MFEISESRVDKYEKERELSLVAFEEKISKERWSGVTRAKRVIITQRKMKSQGGVICPEGSQIQ